MIQQTSKKLKLYRSNRRIAVFFGVLLLLLLGSHVVRARLVDLEAEDGGLVLLRGRREEVWILQQEHMRERRSKERSVDIYSTSPRFGSATRKHGGRVVDFLAARAEQLHTVHVRLVAQSHRKEILVVTENARAAAKMAVDVLFHLKVKNRV